MLSYCPRISLANEQVVVFLGTNKPEKNKFNTSRGYLQLQELPIVFFNGYEVQPQSPTLP